MINAVRAAVSQEQIDAVEAQARVNEEVVRAALSRVPPSWQMIERLAGGGAFRRGSIQVLFSVLRYEDHRIWVHVSASGRTGVDRWFLPTWEDMKRVKHDFVGPDKWAYQVFPSEAKYVNQNPYVLHLYALLEGESALPDFTWGLGTI